MQAAREDTQLIRNKERILDHRWLDCTSIFSQAAFGKDYIVKEAQFAGVQLFVKTGFNFGHLDSQLTKNKYVKGKNKFPGPDHILYNLAYLAKLPEHASKEFTVCYTDRFLGLLESTVLLFVDKSMVPLHRIQIFKIDGQVVWHRKNKFHSTELLQ